MMLPVLSAMAAHALCILPSYTPMRNLVLFRARSRHTYGFEPATAWDLPHLELRSHLLDSQLQLQPASSSSELLHWVDGVDEGVLAAVGRRAILVHMVLAVVATGATLDAACDAAGRSTMLPGSDRVEVVDLARPNLRAEERRAMVARLPLGRGDDSSKRHWVLLRDPCGRAHIGWRTALGPAAGGGGVPSQSARRSYRGVLGRYALKARTQPHGPTTMEPEIGFLMASLARAAPGRVVLDPCCGSCGLLLCAAAFGARVVGVDRNATAAAGATDEFASHGHPPPSLTVGDLLQPTAADDHGSDPLWQPDAYDAIVCDPPYGMAAPLLSRHDSPAVDDAHFTAALLALARRVLLPGGRLVCMVPMRGAEAELSLEEVLRRRSSESAISSGSGLASSAGGEAPPHGAQAELCDETSRTAASRLHLVFGRRQHFSPTFSRWLVCLECRTL